MHGDGAQSKLDAAFFLVEFLLLRVAFTSTRMLLPGIWHRGIPHFRLGWASPLFMLSPYFVVESSWSPPIRIFPARA